MGWRYVRLQSNLQHVKRHRTRAEHSGSGPRAGLDGRQTTLYYFETTMPEAYCFFHGLRQLKMCYDRAQNFSSASRPGSV
eukprot:365542-Chlamydomonas_euryale.AAC.42